MRTNIVTWSAVAGVVGVMASSALSLEKPGTGWPQPERITGLSLVGAHEELGTNVLDGSSFVLTWDKPATPFWEFKVQVKRDAAYVCNGFVGWSEVDDTIMAQPDAWNVACKPGTYTVKVFAYNPNSKYSLASDPLTFVVSQVPTAAPEVTQPEDDSQQELLRDMRWEAVTNAVWYDWMVKTPAGAILKKGRVGDGFGTPDNVAWYEPTSPAGELPVGTGYKLLVRAYTARGGWGPYATNAFDIVAPESLPEAPSGLYLDQSFAFGSNDTHTASRVQAGCSETPNATWYFVEMKRGLALVYRGWTTSPWYMTPSDQRAGVYTLRMKAWNTAGVSPWSETVTQTVSTVGRPATPESLASTRSWGALLGYADVAQGYPCLSWGIVDSCYDYQVRILKNNRLYYSSVVLGLDTSLWTWNNDGIAHWYCDRNLPDGQYTWQVRARSGMSAVPYGDWSAPAPLVIDTTTSVPLLTAPTGINAAAELAFVMGCSTNRKGELSASRYVMEFKRSEGTTNYITAVRTDWDVNLLEEYDAGTLQAISTVREQFPAGQYAWKVTPVNANGRRGTAASGTFWVSDRRD